MNQVLISNGSAKYIRQCSSELQAIFITLQMTGLSLGLRGHILSDQVWLNGMNIDQHHVWMLYILGNFILNRLVCPV